MSLLVRQVANLLADEGLWARFDAKIRKNGPWIPGKPELGRCWLWLAAADENGYGRIALGAREAGICSTHRLAYLRANGRWADPCTCHICNNPACVNPRHLYEGTHEDNNKQASSDGRLQVAEEHWTNRRPEDVTFGEDHGPAVLTEAMAVWALDQIAAGVSQVGIAAELLDRGVEITGAAIWALAHGKSWTHLPRPWGAGPPPKSRGKAGAANSQAVLTEAGALRALALLAEGRGQQAVADALEAEGFGRVTQSTVSRIKLGKSWPDLPRPWK